MLPSPALLELHDRIDRAERFADAATALFDALLTPNGVAYALVLIVRSGELRGEVGIGWSAESVRAIRIPVGDEVHPLVRALRAGAPALLDDETGGNLLGLRRSGVIPLAYPNGQPGSSGAFGVVVLDPGEWGIGEIMTLGDSVRQVGPALWRAAEHDELRDKVRKLEGQRDLFTAIINALPDPVLITDAQNNLILENRRAEALLSGSEEDNEGRRRAVELNNLLFSSFLTRSSDGSAGRELNLVDPSEGGDLLFEVLSTPLPSGLRAEGATVSVLRDVTDLKRAATELEHQFKRVRQAEHKSRRERDRLNLILENVGDPILVTDDQSNIILMNREAERLFEVPPGTDLRSRQRQDVRTNDTKFSSFVSDLALSPDATRITEFVLADPEAGAEFPAEVVSGKILNERSEMTAIVSIIHDLTKVVENERLAAELTQLNAGLEDRVRAATTELEARNRQLEWQSRELQRAYRLKSQFLASMSHELRTPINALLGYTTLMRDHIYGELTDRQDEALDRMYTASQHLLELVNDILDLAKIEAGKMPVHVEPVHLDQLIRELSLTLEPMVRQKQLDFEIALDPDLPLLETDRTKVKQVLLNLLSNAVKFTHEGGVEIRACVPKGGSGVEIAIADTGIGIAEEDLPKVFEDFRQVDQSSTREYGGTGLGLSITKKLLHLLGGTIRVASSPDKGSTFTVWLPRRSDEVVLDDKIAEAARNADEAVLQTPQEPSC